MTLGYIPDRAYYFVVSRTIDLGHPRLVAGQPVPARERRGDALPGPGRRGRCRGRRRRPRRPCPQPRTERRRRPSSARTCCTSAAATARRPVRDDVHRRRSTRATSAPGRRARRCPRRRDERRARDPQRHGLPRRRPRAGRRADGHGLVDRPRSGRRASSATWTRRAGRAPRTPTSPCPRRGPARRRSRSPTGSSSPAVAGPDGKPTSDGLEGDGRRRRACSASSRSSRPASRRSPTRASRSRARSCGSTAARTRTARRRRSSAPTTARLDRDRQRRARQPSARARRAAARARRRAAPSRAWSAGHAGRGATCPAPRTGARRLRGQRRAVPRRRLRRDDRPARAVLGAPGRDRQPARRLAPPRRDGPARGPSSMRAPVVTGSTAFLLGGTRRRRAASTSSVSASLAPQEPFFRLGLVGVSVPALQIGGEIGQQLGYLAAAGVGTGNFVILVVVGWAFNHRPQISDWRERRTARPRGEGARSPSLGRPRPTRRPDGDGRRIGDHRLDRHRDAAPPLGPSERSIAAPRAPATSIPKPRARRPGVREPLAGAARGSSRMPAGLPRAPWTNAAASLISALEELALGEVAAAHPRPARAARGPGRSRRASGVRRERPPRRRAAGRPGPPRRIGR